MKVHCSILGSYSHSIVPGGFEQLDGHGHSVAIRL